MQRWFRESIISCRTFGLPGDTLALAPGPSQRRRGPEVEDFLRWSQVLLVLPEFLESCRCQDDQRLCRSCTGILISVEHPLGYMDERACSGGEHLIAQQD